jgi:transposase
MIDTELYGNIRKCRQQGLSKRRAAAQLGISRNTVKKYWDGAHTPDEHKDYPASVESEAKEAIMEALKKYFEENSELVSRKQAVNAKTAWVALRETFHVGESTIRRYVRELKGKYPEAFIPLAFEPAEVMQVDWCEVKLSVKGHIWKAPVFCAVLPYSYAIFAMVMPDMKMPCFVEGHVRAFEFFHGVPERIFYDNLKAAVLSGYGKNAVKQERFKMLEAHYAFDAVFMNIAAGNEKGSVENLCSLIRQVAFTPIPKGENLKDIQDQVLRHCLDYCKFHRIKDRKRPIMEMMEEERGYLHPLPLKSFEAYEAMEAVVGSDMTFRYDTTKYSVPMEYVGKTVTLRIYPYRVEAWYKGAPAYIHDRPFIRGEHQYIPEHYLPLLEKRPRAVQNAVPLKYGVLPPQLDKFRKLCSEKDKYEQIAKILMLASQVDDTLLLCAVDYANKTGTPTFDKVRLYLELHKASAVAQVNDIVTVDRQGLAQYDDLLDGRSEPSE